MKIYSSLVCMLLLTCPAMAQITFDTASDLGLFNQNGDSSSTFTWSGTAGVGSGGGLLSSSSNFNSSAFIYPTPLNNVLGTIGSVSLDYKMAFQSSGPDIRLGFNASPTGAFDATSNQWIETYGGSSPKSWVTVGSGGTFGFPSVAMTAGNWFRMSFELTKTGANNFSGVFSVYDLGATGLGSPNLLAQQTQAFTDATLGAASNLYAGFYMHNATLGVDNFALTAVPEPTTWAMIGVVVAGTGAYTWKKRRQATKPRFAKAK